MKRLIALVTSLMIGVSLLSPALAQTKEQQLQQILELLDSELASRESQQSADDQELEDAIQIIYDLGITKFNTFDTYLPDNAIRRDEAATMFFRFANKTDNLGAVSTNNCNFSDLGQAHSDLVSVVKDSCKYGLFRGANGKFLPLDSITNAQAVTVMTRVLDGYKSEQTGGHWALNYYNYMKGAGYTSGLAANSSSALDRTITRGDIAIILARVYEDVK